MRTSRFLSILVALSAGSLAAPPPPFAPLENWKAAVMSGDRTALAKLYSTNPPAMALVGRTKLPNLNDELRFWAGLTSSGMTGFNPKALELVTEQGKARLRLRIEGVAVGGEHMVASMVQIWAQQPDGWRILATQRGDFARDARRRLPQPVRPNPHLYPEPAAAPAELKAALATAARQHKRLLLVFGANWCYDCHVLDATFHSKEFAALVNANYVVLHINIGEEGKDNNDLAERFGVAIDRGIPSLAVLDSAGKVVVAQKSGEFQSTVKIGPEEVRAFLEKWKE